MKKFLMYFFVFIFIFFFLPSFLTKTSKEVSGTIENIETSDSNSQNKEIKNDSSNTNTISENGKFSDITTIKLLHTDTQEIEELEIEEYICNVVSAEMPADYELEALKAQATVARTYTIYKIKMTDSKHENADICDESTCCQAWISKEDRLAKWEEDKREENWNKIVKAVEETKGKVITYEGNPINAFFHSNSGGVTEVPVNVWGGSGYPYLQVVETIGEEEYSQYKSEVSLTKLELESILKQSHQDFQIDYSEEDAIKILEYTSSNRIKTLKLGNVEISGVEARKLFGLKSANFEITINEENIIFSVVGYGHGVGMSQTGANTLAKNGNTYQEIIKHFYVGVEIEE